jgi:hypothetical protein
MITESFYLHQDADTIMTITIEGAHQEYFADRIRFELPYHHIFRCVPPDKNIRTFKQIYFFKQKTEIDDEEDDGYEDAEQPST